MANIPQNDTYGTPGATVPTSLRKVPTFTPSTTYQNLARIKEAGGIFNPTPTPAPGSPEDYQARQAGIFQYGTLVNEGMGIPTQTQFLPPVGSPRTPIPLPSDYGSFASPMTINSNGQNISWGTPVNPVIRNLSGDTPGQYVQDLANPDMLVKTQRGSNPTADFAMRAGRLGSMYQVDHIIPLALGGADTLANRQLLTYEQNDKKTKAQAIPYTLYAYGKISLNEARVMAMQWKDRDLSDVPQPNEVGLVPLELATKTAERWTKPKPVTIKDVIANLPEANKNLGKGWLPDPIREFVKGVASGVTMNFIPYEQGEDQGVGSKIAGIGGMIVGTLAPWSLAAKVLAAPFAAVRGVSALLGARRGVAVAEAAANGFGTAEKIASGIKTLNRTPGYVGKFLSDPALIKQAGHFAGTSAVFGQAQQFVANKFNPYTISGEAPETEQNSMIGNIFRDMAIGAVTGVASPTLKGTAYSVATPMALAFWTNPDDPVEALTQGVMFGVMHSTATFRRPGYNDVKMFGGTPYENPVTLAYNHVLDHASYKSLSYYNPQMKEVPMNQAVPKMKPAEIEVAKNNAINNVWQRFFFQKDATPQVEKTTLNRFKEFSRGIDTKLDTLPEVSKLSFRDKFSYSARRAKTAESRAQDQALQEEFGPGFKNKAPEKMPTVPDEGMDLDTALSEIKRITISARQLYKGTLSGEMRNKADLDDLLSFGKMVKDRSKTNLQNRFESQIRFAGSDEPVINSPVARQAVETLMQADPQFMTRSTNYSSAEPSGKFPVGDIALTGAAVNQTNMAKAKYYFEQKALGNASPNVILVRRPDLAPLFSMNNKLLTPEQIKAGDYAIDANPQNTIQAFGIVKNPQTGKIELVELGMVASDHRLNLATGKNHTAFNQHPGVKEWLATGGEKGMKPLTPENHKDTVASVMEKNGLDTLVTNISPNATLETISSKNPYIPLKVNEENWLRSLELAKHHQAQPAVNPISVDIAKVNSALGSKDMVDKIQAMKNNPNRVKPASEYIPKQVTPVNPQTDRAFVPQETTRTMTQTLERSLDVASPAQVKEAFQKNFKIILTEPQAAEIFNKRNDLSMKEGVDLLINAANSGNASVQTKVSMEFVKTYLESGALQASPSGQATLALPLLGKNAKALGVEEHMLPPQVVAQNSTRIAEPTAVSPTREPVTPEPVIQKPDIPSSVTPSEPTGILDRIITAAQRELPKTRPQTQPVRQQIPDMDAGSIAKNYLPEGIAAIESAKPPGRGYTAGDDAMVKAATKKFGETHDMTIRNIEDRIQADLQSRGMPQGLIQEVKNQVRSSLENHSTFILGTSDMPVGNAPIEKPKFVAREFYETIDSGLANKDNPASHYFAKAFDKGLKDMLGPGYRKIPTLPKTLADYFRNVFFSEVNSAGRPIEQHKDVIEARARGDYGAERAAYSARTKQLQDNPTGEKGSLSEAELSRLGVEPTEGEGFLGMQVRPWFQEESMIKDLTRGEDLMAALFAEGSISGTKSVRAVKKLFMGYGKQGTDGLREFILQRHPSAKRSVALDGLEKEAVSFDASHTIKKTTEKAQLKEAEEQLPLLKKELTNLEKAIADPLERSSWQSDEILAENLKSITDKMKRFSKIMEELQPSVKDGGGGPGYHDGKGGLGSFFGGITSGIKKAAQGVGDFLTNTVRYEAPKDPVIPPTPQIPSYDVRGVKVTDDDLSEISAILASEISNRTPDKQRFEVRHIVNTGINRALDNPSYYGDTLTKVFQKPYQYQGYAPQGMTVKGGKTIESQYQKIKAGNIDEPTRIKLEIIKEALEELKSGKFEDTTGGSMFYVHASDGTMWLGSTIKEAKDRANQHERQIGGQRTQWGTAIGLPAELTKAD